MTREVPMTTACAICGQLGPVHYASQKHGWPENDTSLPAAWASLVAVRDLGSSGSREHRLLRCPDCGTFYRYDTDHEYLANGSEDDQTLTRLTADEAAALLGD